MIFKNTTFSGLKKPLILIFALNMLLSPVALCRQDQKVSMHTVAIVEQKRKNAHQKVVQLRWLENLEKNKLYKNQQNMEKTQKDLNVSQNKLQHTQKKLETMRSDLSDAIYDYHQTEALASKRIKQIFKTERVGLIHLLLSSDSVNTLLDRIYYEKIITKRDKVVLNNMRSRARKIAHIKREIENEKYSLNQSIQDINSKKSVIAQSINENQSMINKLKTNRAYYEKSERELAQQSESIRNMIYAMQRRSRGGSSSFVTSTGFIRPVGGYISSPFGWRRHPIFHSNIFHAGVDIAASYGTPIRVSNNGVVMYTGWYGGYGKVVIVNHGNYGGRPTTTLYAHMSSIAARNGQRVSRGSVIGYVGSTGYSTGPHLHFEVRINGQPTNPLAFVR